LTVFLIALNLYPKKHGCAPLEVQCDSAQKKMQWLHEPFSGKCSEENVFCMCSMANGECWHNNDIDWIILGRKNPMPRGKEHQPEKCNCCCMV